jgi:hypothetical protein
MPSILIQHYLSPEGLEIVATEIAVKHDAMEGTIRTEFFTERYVNIQKRQFLRATRNYVWRPSLLKLHKPGKFLPGFSGYDSFYQGVALV